MPYGNRSGIAPLVIDPSTGAISGFGTGAGLTFHGGGTITGASGALTFSTSGVSQFIVNVNGFKFLHQPSGNGGDVLENFFLGYRAGESFVGGALAGYGNTAVGWKAGMMLNGANPLAAANALFGYSAGSALTTGSFNSIFGPAASSGLTTQNGICSFGYHCGANNTGPNNSFFGFRVASSSGSPGGAGGANCAFGVESLGALTSGNSNNAYGVNSLVSTTTGSGNWAFGLEAGRFNTTGSRNLFAGSYAGMHETTASDQFYFDNLERANLAAGKAGAIFYGLFHTTPTSQTLQINAAVFLQGTDTKLTRAGSGQVRITDVGTTSAAVELAHDSTLAASFETSGTGLFIVNKQAGGSLQLQTDGSNPSMTLSGGVTPTWSGGTGNLIIQSSATGNNATMTFKTTTSGGTPTTFLVADVTQGITAASLAGTGSRAVLADANGLLSAPVSDENWKEPLRALPESYGIATVMKLRPAIFKYKDHSRFGAQDYIGFGARATAAVLPEVTGQDRDGTFYLTDEKLTCVLVKAVQQQQEEIEHLKARLDA